MMHMAMNDRQQIRLTEELRIQVAALSRRWSAGGEILKFSGVVREAIRRAYAAEFGEDAPRPGPKKGGNHDGRR